MRLNQINTVELQGYVGSVRSNRLNYGAIYLQLSVATTHSYKKDGAVISETCWHNVNYFTKPSEDYLERELKKGSPVHIIGRMRNGRYTTPDGHEKFTYEILASKVELVKEGE